MDSLSNCTCISTYDNAELIEWTDAFLNELKTSVQIINEAFDSIISIYDDFIIKSQKVASDSLWEYLNEKNLVSRNEHPISYTKLLFRGRVKSNFNENDVNNYFHIPFSIRQLVGNQRFSVSGQPMLYFSSSVLAITKELESSVENLAIAGFLPDYSKYYHSKIFDLQNHLNNSIENTLPGILTTDLNISYYQNDINPNQATIAKDIHETVLMNICTFPVLVKGSFISEYVIPQLLTSVLLQENYTGIIFPSTKDFSNLTGNHRFSSHHLNIGIFVPYDDENDINEKLKGTFSNFLATTDYIDVTVEEVMEKIEAIFKTNKASDVNNNDYIIPVVKLELHLEYVKESKIDGVEYFNTDIGKAELRLYWEMLNFIESSIV
ncbi:MAG: hypothetical protein L3J57_11845 [Desulfuromusa sp.]|nr:hypothetical protein [Desulfuromusa sp.]